MYPVPTHPPRAKCLCAKFSPLPGILLFTFRGLSPMHSQFPVQFIVWLLVFLLAFVSVIYILFLSSAFPASKGYSISTPSPLHTHIPAPAPPNSPPLPPFLPRLSFTHKKWLRSSGLPYPLIFSACFPHLHFINSSCPPSCVPSLPSSLHTLSSSS